MNDRIKKLLEQSYSKAVEECIQRGHQVKQIDAIFNSIAMGEFAELIVRECGVALSPMLRDMISRGQAYDMIKQHFGIE